MSILTKDDLVTILDWAQDRTDAVGVEEFNAEGSAKVYDKIVAWHKSDCDHLWVNTSEDKLFCPKCTAHGVKL